VVDLPAAIVLTAGGAQDPKLRWTSGAAAAQGAADHHCLLRSMLYHTCHLTRCIIDQPQQSVLHVHSNNCLKYGLVLQAYVYASVCLQVQQPV
jgi:hypothetical protein